MVADAASATDATDDARDVLEPASYLSKGEHESEGVGCLLYTSPSPRDRTRSRMPSSA